MKPRPFLHIALFAIIFALIAGCAGVQFTLPDKDKLMHTGPKLVGALIAQNNPDYADLIIRYGDMLLSQGEPTDFQAKLDEGIDWLLREYVDNAAIRVLIVDCLPQVQIEEGTVPSPEWMDKVRPIVEAFIAGVKIGAPQEVSKVTTDFEQNRIEFLIGRTLAVGGL